MGKVTFDISMSLDGLITGPDPNAEQGLGRGGDRLHEWGYGLASWRERHGYEGGTRDADSEVLDEAFRDTGAILMGKGMFELAEGPWGDDPPFHMPVFVLTHEPREPLAKEGGTTFTFVTDGIESALGQAKTAAGGKNVSIAGGADVIQQYLRAGLVDDFQVHLAPLLLGEGVRLFDDLGTESIELERTRVIDSPAVTHLKFRVVK